MKELAAIIADTAKLGAKMPNDKWTVVTTDELELTNEGTPYYIGAFSRIGHVKGFGRPTLVLDKNVKIGRIKLAEFGQVIFGEDNTIGGSLTISSRTNVDVLPDGLKLPFLCIILPFVPKNIGKITVEQLCLYSSGHKMKKSWWKQIKNIKVLKKFGYDDEQFYKTLKRAKYFSPKVSAEPISAAQDDED